MQTFENKIVLCADDDPDDRELLCNTINEIDPSIEVIHTVNGEEALIKLKELNENGQAPCLIILDMNMPKKDGKETIEELKKEVEWSKIPVAVFTTSPSHLYADLTIKYGVKILTKPTKFNTIVKEVSQLLDYCA